MTRRYSVDANHAEIRSTIEALGAYVVDTAHVGNGFPDLLVFFRGRTVLIEVKDGQKPPSRKDLRPSQVVFHAEAKARGGEVYVVENTHDALRIFGARIAA